MRVKRPNERPRHPQRPPRASSLSPTSSGTTSITSRPSRSDQTRSFFLQLRTETRQEMPSSSPSSPIPPRATSVPRQRPRASSMAPTTSGTFSTTSRPTRTGFHRRFEQIFRLRLFLLFCFLRRATDDVLLSLYRNTSPEYFLILYQLNNTLFKCHKSQNVLGRVPSIRIFGLDIIFFCFVSSSQFARLNSGFAKRDNQNCNRPSGQSPAWSGL